MVKTKELYVGYAVYHTPGSCCQRGSTRSEQNHSSMLALIGKEFTAGLVEIFVY